MQKRHESLVNKVKEGDKVIFNVGDNRSPGDWGFASDEEMAPVIDHDGQTATVAAIAIDDGDPVSKIVDGPFYVDIEFADGLVLHGVDGYNLTPVQPQQKFGRSGAPVRHDFIPAANVESLENQAKSLVQTVLKKVREGADDADWEEPGGPSDEQVRANDAAHRARMAGGKRPPHRAPGRPSLPGERREVPSPIPNESPDDFDNLAVQKVMDEVSQWHAGQCQDLITALAELYTGKGEMLNNMDAEAVAHHLREAARILGERTGD